MVACRDSHLSALRHGDPAYKGFSAILACQSITQPTSNRSHPSIPPGLRHGDLTHNTLSATPACQSINQKTSNQSNPSIPPGLRHGDPPHNALSAIPACQTGHLSILRHGDPVYKGLSAIPACQGITQPTSNLSHPSIPPGPRHGDLAHKCFRGILSWPL